MAAKNETKSGIDLELASRILRIVPLPEAFLFFTDIGQYTGEFAQCLADFSEKLHKVSLKSLEFHFERGDFERWIKEILGDEYLTDEISKIDRAIRGEELRSTIQGIVKNRLDQLKAATMTNT